MIKKTQQQGRSKNIRLGDTVIVIAGKEKTKTGKIIKYDTATQRVLVEGLNMITKRIKPNAQNPQGKLEKIEGSIHVSNVMLLDPTTQKPARVRRIKTQEGKTIRQYKKSNQEVK